MLIYVMPSVYICNTESWKIEKKKKTKKTHEKEYPKHKNMCDIGKFHDDRLI